MGTFGHVIFYNKLKTIGSKIVWGYINVASSL